MQLLRLLSLQVSERFGTFANSKKQKKQRDVAH